MLPSQFHVENYRSFARRQEIQLRPLTLIFGWNSGGKSALVRFLPLLAESLRVGGLPLWLAGEVGRGTTWPELVCRATERRLLRFGLKWPDGNEIDCEVLGDPEGRYQDFSSVRVGTSEGVTEAAESDPSRPNWPEVKKWWGSDPRTAGAGGVMDNLANEVQWIAGLRQRPDRVTTYSGGTPARLRPAGEDAVAHLVAAQLRSQTDPVLEATRRFFRSMGEDISVDSPALGIWRVMLAPLAALGVRVNLCDTGEGYAQALPIVVALARAQHGGPRLVCLEQPELHLHTSAQLKLADELILTAQCDRHPSLLIETHSEVLLMCVQLAVAEGRIAPDQVGIYWVEAQQDGTSDARLVELDRLGRPTSAVMAGAFEQAIKLGEALFAARRRDRS